MAQADMKDTERITKAQDLLTQLEAIEAATKQVGEQLHTAQKPSDTLAALRLRLSAVEHQAALLRLLQAEDRLRHNLWKLGAGFAGVLLGFAVRSFV